MVSRMTRMADARIPLHDVWETRDRTPRSFGDFLEGVPDKTDDAAQFNYWIASPSGLLYQTEMYSEDADWKTTISEKIGSDEKQLELAFPVMNLARAIMHARVVSKGLGCGPAQVLFYLRYNDLTDRYLYNHNNLEINFNNLRYSAIREVWERVALVDTHTQGQELVENVSGILGSLWSHFGCLQMHDSIIKYFLNKTAILS